MVELKGSLNSIGLPAIVQLIGELRHSGSLELAKGAARGVLDFDDGRLVAADFGDESGFKALATLSRELGDGEFTFVEGAPMHERTLDLESKDAQAYLQRMASGEDVTQPAEPPPVEQNGVQSLGTCPLLGFADDQARHYSRATALHRCYATGAPSLVTGDEQRELCLGGRYPTCPRYRNASPLSSTTITAAADSAVAAPAPVRVAELTPDHETPALGMPAGVASRMAVASTMHLANGPSNGEVTTSVGHDRENQPGPADPRPPATRTRVSLRRAMLLIGGGALVGLALMVGVVVVSLPAANGGLSTQKPSVAGAQSFAPAPTLTRGPAVATPAAAAPTTAPAATAVSRPSTPTAAPRPTVTPAGQALLDVRFAAGPADGWLDNPPFAAWSDGAFRLQAHQATRFVAAGAPIEQLLSDVVVSATFRKTGGPPGGGYGLVVRDQGPDPRDGVNQSMNAYVFEAGDLGEFGIWRRDGDHWVDLVPWMRSAAVRPGGSPNDLAVRAIGETLTFSINATQVASVQDDTLPAGGVGVFIGGDYNDVAVDRFTVQVPD